MIVNMRGLVGKDIFRRSNQELFKLKKLVFASMLLAIVVVLKTVGLNNDYVKMGLNAIPANLAYYILGPIGGAIFGALSDILGVIVLGQSLNPLLTVTGALAGFIAGFILYGHPVSLWRVILAVVLKALICSIFLNTLIISAMYGAPFRALLVSRLVKNAVEVPVTVVIYYFIVKGLEKAGLFRQLQK